jgi:hypothetical protein
MTIDAFKFNLLHGGVLTAGVRTDGIRLARLLDSALRIVLSARKKYAERTGSRKFHGGRGKRGSATVNSG